MAVTAVSCGLSLTPACPCPRACSSPAPPLRAGPRGVRWGPSLSSLGSDQLPPSVPTRRQLSVNSPGLGNVNPFAPRPALFGSWGSECSAGSPLAPSCRLGAAGRPGKPGCGGSGRRVAAAHPACWRCRSPPRPEPLSSRKSPFGGLQSSAALWSAVPDLLTSRRPLPQAPGPQATSGHRAGRTPSPRTPGPKAECSASPRTTAPSASRALGPGPSPHPPASTRGWSGLSRWLCGQEVVHTSLGHRWQRPRAGTITFRPPREWDGSPPVGPAARGPRRGAVARLGGTPSYSFGRDWLVSSSLSL